MTRISKPADLSTAKLPVAAASNGKTILIAEDDPFISRMYEIKLTSAGFAVVVKNNGREAYEAIKASKPDLLVLDLNMPELSGFDVLAALQADSFDFASCPAIILTNSSNIKDRETAQKYGVDYLIKAELTPRAVLDRINIKLNLKPIPEAPAA